MAGDHPASYRINASHTQDWILALMSPFMLIVITVPFTVLRILLLGWNCTLTRQFWDEDTDDVAYVSYTSDQLFCMVVAFAVYFY